jgi:hypothetical protein
VAWSGLCRRAIAALLFGGALGWAAAAFAQDAADEEERSQRRLQFNRYAEERFAREAAGPRAWDLSASVLYGYDDNPSLSSLRRDDLFTEENLKASLRFGHAGAGGIFGPGTWGVGVRTSNRDYDEEDRFDFQTVTVSPRVTADVWGGLTLELGYDFDIVRYVHSGRLDYTAHGGRAKLAQPLFENLSHFILYAYEEKRYRERDALTGEGFSAAMRREDAHHRLTYGALASPWKATSLGLAGSAYWNDSNDAFLDFHDYSGGSVSGFVAQKLSDRLEAAFTWGYDRKEYDDRLFAVGSDAAEADDYFYLGLSGFYRLTPWAEVGVAWLYGQNDSNSPAQEYSFSTVTTGFYFRF